ncbi:MAG: tRNA pseudouridine(55) synthase TruB [Candidatus Zixiibacteriota bacterium]
MENRFQRLNGVLLLNKRPGISSHQAVLEVRQIIRQRRVGHTGTLDPKAEGLVVVCIGRATKIVQFVSDFDKTYEARIVLGQTSTTFDSEGTILDNMPKAAPDYSTTQFQAILNEFVGQIRQKVPAHSAVRVNGNRLYNYARAGQEVDLPVRDVEIKSLEAIWYVKPELAFRVNCSKGTYIRSLASDIGERLECGAYLSGLKRTGVGNLKLENSMTIDEIDKCHEQGKLNQKLLTFDDVLNYNGILVSDRFRDQVLNGLDLTPSDVLGTVGEFSEGDRIILKDQEGTPLAIGRAEVASSKIKQAESNKIFTYTRVLN